MSEAVTLILDGMPLAEAHRAIDLRNKRRKVLITAAITGQIYVYVSAELTVV